MSIITDTRAYEEEHKQMIYDAIEKIIVANAEVIDVIEKTNQYIDINSKVPNIGITLNNKINQISQEFERSGISMFDSYVGLAIMEDLIPKASDAMEALKKYNSSTEKAVHKRVKGPIRKLLFIVKSIIFNSSTMANENEREQINSHLSEYSSIDEEIYGYNIRDNIVSTLARKIINDREINRIIGISDKERVVYDVEPTLKALGLENLIPQLMEKLETEEKQPTSIEDKKSWDLGNWGIDIEEFRKETTEISRGNNGKENETAATMPLIEDENIK